MFQSCPVPSTTMIKLRIYSVPYSGKTEASYWLTHYYSEYSPSVILVNITLNIRPMLPGPFKKCTIL